MTFPNTPSQRWARAQGACRRGRTDLGRKTIGEYFRKSVHKGNLFWILCKLTESVGDHGCRRHPDWINTMVTAMLTPKQIRAIAYENGVQIPLEIS